LELCGLSCARRSRGHEIDLPPAFARRSVQPPDLIRLVRVKCEPPLGRATDVVPDALHCLGTEWTGRSVPPVVSGAVKLRSRLAEGFIEVRDDAIDVESYTDAHPAGSVARWGASRGAGLTASAARSA